MIDFNYMTVKGYCDTPKELQDYLECLSLLPARIISWSIIPNEEIRKMQFRIEYQPLTR